MRKVPPVGTPTDLLDIARALLLRKGIEGFAQSLKGLTGRRFAIFVNSGTTAYYLILRALSRMDERKGVFLPAYTAPSLILPIERASLKPGFVDVDLRTFNARTSFPVTDDTLAITVVHMYGIPTWFSREEEEELRERGIFLIEDLASALGSTLGNRPCGSFGDVSFVSFNRGKNLSTATGGAVLIDREDLYRLLLDEAERLPEPSLPERLNIFLRTVALSFAVRPWFYGLFRPLVSRYRYKGLHQDFRSLRYTPFQAALGAILMERGEEIFRRRYQNGMHLYAHLSGVKGIRLPAIPEDSRPAFNQFPLVVEDPEKRDTLYEALTGAGIEATTLYPEPIHRAYNLFKGEDPFPNATYLARRILLIPVHPYVEGRDIERAARVVRKCLTEATKSAKKPKKAD